METLRPTGKTCESCNQPTHVTYSVTAWGGPPPAHVEHHYCKKCWYFAETIEAQRSECPSCGQWLDDAPAGWEHFVRYERNCTSRNLTTGELYNP